MSVEILTTESFKKSFKPLMKKYRNIIDDLENLTNTLKENPQAGEAIPGLDQKVWKIRMPSSDMKKGKSGGFRIIYFYFLDSSQKLYLLYIYAKSQQENIANNQIIDILKDGGLWGESSPR